MGYAMNKYRAGLPPLVTRSKVKQPVYKCKCGNKTHDRRGVCVVCRIMERASNK